MEIITRNGLTVAILDRSERIVTVQDALDAMATARYLGGSAMVIAKENLDESFFDLKTGLAGEILQKFSNYRFRVSIVGDFSGYKSKALHDFIYECNKGNLIFFKSSPEGALDALAAAKT